MSFCTAINCMDGRVQLPVNEYLRGRYGVDYVDTITEPGPNGILAAGTDAAAVDSILRRVDISVHKHGSRAVVIVGHYECTGNPADKVTQIRQLHQAVALLAGRYADVEILAVWVDENGRVSQVIPKKQSAPHSSSASPPKSP